jgi:putative tryptophan/tyrosine transport system substrate-binding protein
MIRRDFITLLGGAAVAWPLAARGQQPAMPAVGLLDQRSPDELGDRLRGFREGLKEAGFVEGESVAIEYRWAKGQYDRLPELAAELVRRQVGVIAATGGHPAAFAAKAATTTIPVVFISSDDPVRLGLVASLARPGSNLTGINFFSGELTAKRLELLHELVPAATRVAVLVNPANTVNVEATLKEVGLAARGIGLQVQILNASTIREINAAFATFVHERPDALLVGIDPFFNSRRTQLVHLATRYAIPASYPARDFAEAGGLMSYGANIADAWRQVGSYVGRILKGAKPADLPVVQSTKFELIINAQTATMLGLTVPAQLLARADGVIE